MKTQQSIFEPDNALRYLTMGGGVRIGRILEDMDIFAVHLVFKHVDNPRQVLVSSASKFPSTFPYDRLDLDLDVNQGPHLASPLSIVTAMVDSIDFTRPLRYL